MAGTMLNMTPITQPSPDATPRPPVPEGRIDPPRPSVPPTAPNAPVNPNAPKARLLGNMINDFLPKGDGETPSAVVTPPTTPQDAPAPVASPVAAPAAKQEGFMSSIPDGVLLGEAEPKPEVKPEVKAVEINDPVPPEVNSNPKAANEWARIRGENRTLEAEVQRLKAEVEAAKAKPVEVEEVVTLKKRTEELENQLGQLDVTRSESFKKTYDMPIQLALKTGVDTLVANGFDPKAAQEMIVKATKLTGDALEDFLGDQKPYVQGVIGNLVTNVRTQAAAREQAILKWKETRAAQDTSASRERAAKLSESIERDTSSAIAQVVKEGNVLFDAAAKGVPPEKAAEWQAKVQSRIDAVKGILRAAASPQGKDSDLVRYVADGITAPELRTELKNAVAYIRKLESELKERNGLTPRLSAGGGAAPVPASGGRPVPTKDFVANMLANLPR